MKRLSKRDRETMAEMLAASKLSRIAAEIVAETNKQQPILANNIRPIHELLNRPKGEELTVKLTERDWRIVRLSLVQLFRSLNPYRDVIMSEKA